MDFTHIIEEKIRRAYDDGEFENLPGFGKPLILEDFSGIPEELRMAYRLLKNAGYSEEENKIRKEMMTIEDLIRKCQDSEEKKNLQKRLNQKLHLYNGMMSKKGAQTNSSLFKNYEQKIHKKLGV